ncbi:hypothetical protein ANN_09268 [Periplaneta americana]|uniref:Uncharacterized protein n=1 Tax=Periplaneta americana TaxID=6978 RepID=A0ABQ8TKV6_PERAM|nr:hypothetical protein ANN_09268 [Periplaneta americana]
MTKTQLMTNRQEIPISIDGTTLPYATEYTYLGQLISFKDKTGKEIRRISLAWKSFWSLQFILLDKTINRRLKFEVLQACVYPTLLYGCQTWSTTNRQMNALEICQRKMERKILGITMRDRISNESLSQMASTTNVTQRANKLKWKWGGHIARMKDERWTYRATMWDPRTGDRHRGIPRKRWADFYTTQAGQQWSRIARSRGTWRTIWKSTTNEDSASHKQYPKLTKVALQERSANSTREARTVGLQKQLRDQQRKNSAYGFQKGRKTSERREIYLARRYAGDREHLSLPRCIPATDNDFLQDTSRKEQRQPRKPQNRIQNISKLSLTTAMSLFHAVITPIASYGIELIWEKLTNNDLAKLENVKARFLKRVLGVGKQSPTRIVYVLAKESFFIEDLRLELMLPSTGPYQAHLETRRRKQEDIDPDFYCTSAMTDRKWTETCQDQRHVVTRLAIHGFHHKICRTQRFHHPDDD